MHVTTTINPFNVEDRAALVELISNYVQCNASYVIIWTRWSSMATPHGPNIFIVIAKIEDNRQSTVHVTRSDCFCFAHDGWMAGCYGFPYIEQVTRISNCQCNKM